MSKTYYAVIKLVVETELGREEAQMLLDSELCYEFDPPDGIDIIETEYIETYTKRPL